MLAPEYAELAARAELCRRELAESERRVELQERIEQEKAASRQRRDQRQQAFEQEWRERCAQRGIPPYPRPRIKCTRADGVEVISTGRTGSRMVWGCASSPKPNSHNYALITSGCKIVLPVPLKCRHKRGAVGDVVWLRKSAKSLFVRAVLYDTAAANYAWKLLMDGELKAFSASAEQPFEGGTEVNGITFHDRWTLKEISLTPTGANPDAWCRIYGHGGRAALVAVAAIPWPRDPLTAPGGC